MASPTQNFTRRLYHGAGEPLSLATTLAETRVLFDNVAAPLVYVSASQLSAIVPYGVAGKATTAMQVAVKGPRTKK